MAKRTEVMIGGRIKSLDGRLAKAMIRMGKAKPVVHANEYNTRMMVASEPVKQDEKYNRQELMDILDAAGVEYSKRLGEKKLTELVESLKEDEE